MGEMIQIEKVQANENQPRQHFEGIEELAENIRQHGLLTPILVRPIMDTFEIVHGERRYRACKLLGMEEIRAEVRELDDQAAFTASLIENVQRDSLTPLEEAKAFQRMLDGGMTQAELGDQIGKSQQYVSTRLALLGLAPEAAELVRTGKVNVSVGRTLASVEDARFQNRMAKKAATGNLRTRDLDREIEKWKIKTYDREKLKKALENYPEIKEYQEAIEKGELKVIEKRLTKYGLEIQDTTKNFTGQPFTWPRYSGQRYVSHDKLEIDQYGECLDVPLFEKDEWELFNKFSWAGTRTETNIDGSPNPFYFEFFDKGFSFWAVKDNRSDNLDSGPLHRRIYDPEFGHFISEKPRLPDCKPPIYVKQGWGQWEVIEFNDGEGGRERRRFFLQDYIGPTLIKELANTVDPWEFTDHNLRELNIIKEPAREFSWFYARMKRLPRGKAIELLEKDLEMLKEQEPKTDEELEQDLLELLKEYITEVPMHAQRELSQTYPRNPDGTVDEFTFEEVYY